MRLGLGTSPDRVDPAIVALRRVVSESARLSEALAALDEAGGLGRAVQAAGDELPIRRTAAQIREARDGLSATLGRLAALVRDGAIG